jgi:hypothetical protein
VQLAAGLIGATVVAVDPSVGFDGVTKVLADEGVRVLFMSPRHAGENRLAQLHTVFAEELDRFNRTWDLRDALSAGWSAPIRSPLVVPAEPAGDCPVVTLPLPCAVPHHNCATIYYHRGADEWGYAPFNSKRLRAFKYIVQTGTEETPGIVNFADLPVYGESESSACRCCCRDMGAGVQPLVVVLQCVCS